MDSSTEQPNRYSRPLLPRLIDFAVSVSRWSLELQRDPTTAHAVSQLNRSASAPFSNYAESQGGASRRDFLNKLQICEKELREAKSWLDFAERAGHASPKLAALQRECDELIAMIVASIKKTKRRM